MRRALVVSALVILGLSLALNVMLYLSLKNSTRYVVSSDANTRDTYDTVHHIREAQTRATGKGIRVGILDKYFGFTKHRDLYAGGMDFVGEPAAFADISEHGFWMATTLKEISPGVEVIALNVRNADKAREADAIVKAVTWAIGEHVNVLTWSAEPFGDRYRQKIDDAIGKAIRSGIVTTFIHYPLAENILPTGLVPNADESEERPPDLSVYHFDYNTLILFVYDKHRKLLEAGARPHSGDEVPYLSISSTSPVLAGIVAMMMEVRGGLPPAEYKRVLIATSRPMTYKGRTIEHVADAVAALDGLTTPTTR